MSFKVHIANQINEVNGMLGIIKRNFRDIKQDAFIIMLYKSLVGSHHRYFTINERTSSYTFSYLAHLATVNKHTGTNRTEIPKHGVD